MNNKNELGWPLISDFQNFIAHPFRSCGFNVNFNKRSPEKGNLTGTTYKRKVRLDVCLVALILVIVYRTFMI